MAEPTSTLALVLADLAAEGEELDARVATLPAAGWAKPTPAAGWSIAHQIAHLNWTDRLALLAIEQPDRLAEAMRRASADPARFVDDAAATGAALPPDELLAGWRAGRAELAERLAAVQPGRKLAWFGPPMSAASMATARLMETWAHGLDVAEALGEPPRPTNRLQHVARLAVRTRDFAFRLHGLEVPAGEFRIELTTPDGSRWQYGPADAGQSVTGPAFDFCLLAVQRRHRRDVALVAHGPQAEIWLEIIQAFAGPPGAGRAASR
ncbi:MAG TPA: TIGR03084 family metal-binding protein [Jatrophihabitans sp.]|nr:TIGR03084 family metal-binding protein [Jatrophihabitans sp.]